MTPGAATASVRGQQPIVRVRRQYNQWVADQTLEDYALRFTADKARRWSSFRVGNTALGAISFLACEAIGGTITLTFGFENAMLAILAVGILIFLTSLPIGYYAAKSGVDMDLLTRGCGFGYIGSTITSLIYASFTFILFAVEATITSQALVMVLGIPIAFAHLVSALMGWRAIMTGSTCCPSAWPARSCCRCCRRSASRSITSGSCPTGGE
jgi:cytosine/uracil/thiamine/allantoin permease